MRISIPAAAFSLLLSVSLWLYISLQADYEVTIPVRLKWNLPPNRSLESPLPSQVYVKLMGNGWNLLNALYIDRSARVEVTLPSQQQTGTLTEAELRAGFRTTVPLRVMRVEPATISYQLGVIAQKKVPITSDVHLIPAEGYVVARPLVLVPDSVVLIGSQSVLDTIQTWRTQAVVRSELRKSIVELVELARSPIVRILPERVLIRGVVQQLAEVTYEDVPVTVERNLSVSEQLLPSTVRVTVRGGLDDIESLLDRGGIPVSVSVSQEQLRQKSELIQPIVRAPSWVVATCQPRWLLYRRIQE